MIRELPLPRLGLGTAALGHLFREVDDAEARLGRALKAYPRSSYRVSTKISSYRCGKDLPHRRMTRVHLRMARTSIVMPSNGVRSNALHDAFNERALVAAFACGSVR